MLIKFKDGRNYDVRFVYSKNQFNTIDTKCEVSEMLYDSIEEKNNFNVLWEGLALQNPKDQHVKSIARKVSLANAIAPLSKGDRSTIWEQYNQQVKK